MFAASITNVDNAGGGLLRGGGGAHQVKVNGKRWAVLGDLVSDHGTGPHDAATMTSGSSFVRIKGIPVIRAGHLASCGHAATGSELAVTIED